MKKIIVTGGTGYIGSHTVVSLIEQGYEVVIIDNLINSDKSILRGIQNITGVLPTFYDVDLCDEFATSEVFEKHKDTDAIIHFAALKGVGESVVKPVSYYKNNLFGLLNVLENMQKNAINNIVFSSSATVYGDTDILPFTENLPRKPALSPYANTKKMGEDFIRDTAKADDNFNAISLRYFNPIGAHDSAEIGESPNGIPNNLMPFITQTAIGLRKELLVFGNDYDTIDGTAVRDYIHVLDLADAHVKAVARLVEQEQKTNYEIFNLGTGTGSSVLEVIQSFERTSGKKLTYRIVERRAGDIPVMYASTDLANNELGWKSKLSLDDMTASSWKWESKIRGIK
ncbi:MAG: UDP-glucose 4-epimerase GalE [Saprospiraceae bacterium]